MGTKNKTKLKGNTLSWILRIFLLLTTLFFLMFSFDVFSEKLPFWEILFAFAMHNIFTIILTIILFIVWKWEHIGGILLLAISIFMMFFFGGSTKLMWGTWLLICLPFLAGILFLCNHFLIRRKILR